MKKLWKEIRYVMGWFPRFETPEELINYPKFADIETACMIVKKFKHISSHDYENSNKEIIECLETYTADCYGKMVMVEAIFRKQGIQNNRIYFTAEKGSGHVALYFTYKNDSGIISNGNLYLYINRFDKDFKQKVLKLIKKETGKIYTGIKVY